MAHRALRPMKWGTSKGTVSLKTNQELPEPQNTPHRMLDRLYQRGWITDSNGKAFADRHSVHAIAAKPAAPVAPAPPAEPALTEAKLVRMGREALNDLADEHGVEDPEDYANKGELVEAILAAAG